MTIATVPTAATLELSIEEPIDAVDPSARIDVWSVQ
jgi:hypothetical protein